MGCRREKRRKKDDGGRLFWYSPHPQKYRTYSRNPARLVLRIHSACITVLLRTLIKGHSFTQRLKPVQKPEPRDYISALCSPPPPTHPLPPPPVETQWLNGLKRTNEQQYAAVFIELTQPRHIVQVQCCFTSTQTIRDWEPKTSTSTVTQLLSSHDTRLCVELGAF